jgi:hypothetical protein
MAYTWTSSHKIFTSGIMVIMGSDHNLGWDIIIAGSYFCIIKLTPWGRVLCKKLITPQLVKKFPAF